MCRKYYKDYFLTKIQIGISRKLYTIYTFTLIVYHTGFLNYVNNHLNKLKVLNKNHPFIIFDIYKYGR